MIGDTHRKSAFVHLSVARYSDSPAGARFKAFPHREIDKSKARYCLAKRKPHQLFSHGVERGEGVIYADISCVILSSRWTATHRGSADQRQRQWRSWQVGRSPGLRECERDRTVGVEWNGFQKTIRCS